MTWLLFRMDVDAEPPLSTQQILEVVKRKGLLARRDGLEALNRQLEKSVQLSHLFILAYFPYKRRITESRSLSAAKHGNLRLCEPSSTKWCRTLSAMEVSSTFPLAFCACI